MPGRTNTRDRIIRVCVLINAALILGSLLNAARTGHLAVFLIIWGAGSLLAALVYIRNR
jgi:hypothetical protein